jgi:hypothetical protein
VSGNDDVTTFQVRSAGPLTGVGVFLFITGQLTLFLGIYVGVAVDLVGRGGDPSGTTIGLAFFGWAATLAGVGCVIGGFIRLCSYVEYLARAEVDRRGGDPR